MIDVRRRRNITAVMDVLTVQTARVVAKLLPIAVLIWLAFLFGGGAWGAELPPSNPDDVDEMAKAIRSSGPATGAVLVLGLLLKAWAIRLEGRIDALQKDIKDQSQQFITAREAMIRSDAKIDDHERRIRRLEQRVSGTYHAATE